MISRTAKSVVKTMGQKQHLMNEENAKVAFGIAGEAGQSFLQILKKRNNVNIKGIIPSNPEGFMPFTGYSDLRSVKTMENDQADSIAEVADAPTKVDYRISSESSIRKSNNIEKSFISYLANQEVNVKRTIPDSPEKQLRVGSESSSQSVGSTMNVQNLKFQNIIAEFGSSHNASAPVRILGEMGPVNVVRKPKQEVVLPTACLHKNGTIHHKDSKKDLPTSKRKKCLKNSRKNQNNVNVEYYSKKSKNLPKHCTDLRTENLQEATQKKIKKSVKSNNTSNNFVLKVKVKKCVHKTVRSSSTIVPLSTLKTRDSIKIKTSTLYKKKENRCEKLKKYGETHKQMLVSCLQKAQVISEKHGEDATLTKPEQNLYTKSKLQKKIFIPSKNSIPRIELKRLKHSKPPKSFSIPEYSFSKSATNILYKNNHATDSNLTLKISSNSVTDYMKNPGRLDYNKSLRLCQIKTEPFLNMNIPSCNKTNLSVVQEIRPNMNATRLKNKKLPRAKNHLNNLNKLLPTDFTFDEWNTDTFRICPSFLKNSNGFIDNKLKPNSTNLFQEKMKNSKKSPICDIPNAVDFSQRTKRKRTESIPPFHLYGTSSTRLNEIRETMQKIRKRMPEKNKDIKNRNEILKPLQNRNPNLLNTNNQKLQSHYPHSFDIKKIESVKISENAKLSDKTGSLRSEQSKASRNAYINYLHPPRSINPVPAHNSENDTNRKKLINRRMLFGSKYPFAFTRV